MPLLNWFSRKSSAPVAEAVESSGLGYADATEPGGSGRSRPGAAVHGTAADRKSERLERREMLYTIVRECMAQAGMLSASYKFKVLSLDARGREYLVMVDLPSTYHGETGRLTVIEGLIARSAKIRHGILVGAVYWRHHEPLAPGVPAPAGKAAMRSDEKLEFADTEVLGKSPYAGRR